MTNFLFSLFFFLLCSCARARDITSDLNIIAAENGFTKVLVRGGDFWITTYQRMVDSKLPYVFYIEGDGSIAVAGGTVASSNPTPKSIMLFRLAVMDRDRNVVYIGRPCQYTPMSMNSKCNRSFWTDKRFSEEIVVSMNEVVNQVSETGVRNQKFSLVGYSGGGAISILIAARNPRVEEIITVAGNLNHEKFNKLHKTNPLYGSLNPIDYANVVNNVLQTHLVGLRDKVVSSEVIDTFVDASNNPRCIRKISFPDNSHSIGWVNN